MARVRLREEKKEGPSVLALTQGLIISGGLNLFLLILLLSSIIKDKPALAFSSFREHVTPFSKGKLGDQSVEFVNHLATLSFDQIVSFLGDGKVLEDGFTKQDLALSWLVSAHRFDLKRALFGLPKPVADRTVYVPIGGKTKDLRLYPKLPATHLAAIQKFLNEEKWPFDSEGLYNLLLAKEKDPTLAEAFSWTKEYLLVERILKDGGVEKKAQEIIDKLVGEGWSLDMWRFPEQEKLFSLFLTSSRPVDRESSKKAVKSRSKKTYKVQEGDSFWKISKKLGIPTEALQVKNPGITMLKPGMELQLP